MAKTFDGRFFDGSTAADQQATASFDADGLRIHAGDASILWVYKKILKLDASAGQCRLGYKSSPDAILILPEDALTELAAMAPRTHGPNAGPRKLALAVGAMIAGAAIVGAGLFIGVPAAAGPLTRSTPKSLEVQIGTNMAAQINTVFRPCGDEDALTLVQSVLDDMAIKGDVGFEINFTFVRTAAPNAFALPGGHVMATTGLLNAVEDDQEAFFAVMAHELGHVRGRDGMVAFYRNAGLGVALEIVTGGSGLAQQAVLLGGQLTQLRHTREQEAQADEAAFTIMTKSGLDPASLARAFEAITKKADSEALEEDVGGKKRKLPTWLKSHPDTKERIDTAKAQAGETSALPLSEDEWNAVRNACTNDEE